MWMCYGQQYLTAPTDLRSAVQRLQQMFQDLAFDAGHEAVYGLDQFYSEEELQRREEKFRVGVELCQKFVNDSICVQCLREQLIKCGLENYITELDDFLCAMVNDGTSR